MQEILRAVNKLVSLIRFILQLLILGYYLELLLLRRPPTTLYRRVWCQQTGSESTAGLSTVAAGAAFPRGYSEESFICCQSKQEFLTRSNTPTGVRIIRGSPGKVMGRGHADCGIISINWVRGF